VQPGSSGTHHGPGTDVHLFIKKYIGRPISKKHVFSIKISAIIIDCISYYIGKAEADPTKTLYYLHYVL